MKLEEVRPELRWFVKKMESRMAVNDGVKSGWEVEPLNYFLGRIDDAASGLSSRIVKGCGVLEKAADISNYAMMLAYVWMNGISLGDRRSAEDDFPKILEDKTQEHHANSAFDRLNKLENAVDVYLKYCGPCETDTEEHGFCCDWDDCPYCNLYRIVREGR